MTLETISMKMVLLNPNSA